MTRPGLYSWATNTNHPAGGDPWAGMPTKVAPTSGKQAAGYEPTERISAEELNFLLNNILGHAAWNAGNVLLNWDGADVSRVTFGGAPGNWPGVGTPLDICYDASLRMFTAMCHNGITLITIDPTLAVAVPGGMGYVWDHEVTYGANQDPSTAGWMGAASCKIKADGAGIRIAVGGCAADTIRRSTAPGTWATIAAAYSVPAVWQRVDHDGSGLWVIGGQLGEICSSPTGAPPSVWTPRASGLIANPITVLVHTRDAANPAWLAGTSAEFTRSTNGTTWTAAAHGWPSTPVALDYSPIGTRWLALSSLGTLRYSTNNGVSWTSLGTPFPAFPATPYTAEQVSLVSDRCGGWICTCDKGAWQNAVVYGSIDNGATWKQIFTSAAAGMQGQCGAAFGDGMFVAVGPGGAIKSLRSFE